MCSVSLVLLGALVLATSANASELPVTTPSPEPVIVQVPEVATVETQLPAAEAPAPVAETPQPEAPAPVAETLQPEAPAASQPAETPPPEAPAAEPPVVEVPPVEAPAAPAPPEPPPVEAPAAPAGPEVHTEVHVEVPALGTTAEPASEKPVTEHPQDAGSGSSQSEAVTRATETPSKGTQSLSSPGAAPPPPPGAGLAMGAATDPVLPITGTPADGTAEPLTEAAARAVSATIAARKSAAFGAGPLECAKALEAGTGACSSWVVAPQRSESSILPFGGSDGPLPPGPNGGATADGGGHSVVSAPPGNPTPGPQPGGGSGGASAVGGGGGLAMSGFLTLAGLLLLAAPRAMRRLRLLCRPWRTACFALIPERPG